MSQFGNGAKNPPWVRNAQQTMSSPQIQSQLMSQAMSQQNSMNPAVMVQYQQQQQVYQQMQSPMQQGGMNMSPMSGMNQGMSPMNQGIYPQVTTVSYPTPRALNPTAFQSPQQIPASPVPPTNNNPSPKQRVFTGSVTKVHDNFGFVDEDVFFQTSCCVKGSNPMVGDRVLVEASYNPSMPFKWNATRIQVLPMSGGGGGSRSNPPKNTGYNAVPPPSENCGGGGGSGGAGSGGSNNNRGQKRMPRSSGGGRERVKEDRNRDEDEEIERKKRRDERQREREEKDKSEVQARRRSKSPRPAPRRRTRVVPRYMVQIPKIALDMPEADVLELRRRYNNMYVPSDFFCTNFRWVDAFPPHSPFTLDRPCNFHVLHKEVDPVAENTAVLEPQDADYLFSAKVMLISMPSMEEIYRKCCALAEDKEKDSSDDARDFVHPTRLVNFLVGLRGKNETMAVGGPWSPSLDGQDPEKDPTVLIKTAIRSCKALTGIDLSHCTQWYRFLELYYRRAETTSKGRLIPARVETVVLFLPDVWSCVPTRLEYDTLLDGYKFQLNKKQTGRQIDDPDKSLTAADVGEDADEKDKDDSITELKREPTHFSELDPKTMKVNDLRQELEARTMSPKGLKSQLVARLAKAIKTEADKAEEDEGNKPDEPEPVVKPEVEEKEEEKTKKDEEDKKKNEERDRVTKEKRYILPDAPHITVHPSKTAKGGKFDCTVMSLSLLLDYRPEDTKEHSFEVSLFAELFNEMLMRDYGFRIYRALHAAPEPVKEDKDEKNKKEKEKEKKDGDKEKKKDEKREKRDDKNKPEEKEKKEEKDEDEEEDDEEEEDDDSKSSKSKDKDSKEDKDKRREKDRKKKDRPKLFTEDPHLLLSFVYFDQSHCGYIFDKDIEELLYTLGLNLSRAQVRKLVQKVVLRDSLHYRKMTDKPVEVKEVKEAKDDSVKEVATNGVAESTEILVNLAYGNKRLLPAFNVSGPPSKRARKDGEEELTDIPEGFVTYKGSLLDVTKLMDALKRSEKARCDTETQMVAIKGELDAVKNTASQSANQVKELASELKEVKATLGTTKAQLTKTKVSSDVYLTMLKEVRDNITSVITPPPSTTVLKVEKLEEEEPGKELPKLETRWSGPAT